MLATKLFFKKSPVLTADDLKRHLGSRQAVIRAANEGHFVLVGSGYYAAADVDPAIAPVLVVAKYFPRAVVSGVSALALHGLTDELPDRVSVDIDAKTSIRNKILKIKRVSPKFLTGIETRKIHGLAVRLYDRERCLCDIFRREKDGPIFLKALKRYVKTGPVRAQKIAVYDKVLGTSVLARLSQELADG